MKRKGIFAPNDAEKRQLEEIAHLYFSTPDPAKEAPTQPLKSEAAFCAPLDVPPSFFVCCTAGGYDASLASAFLYNLGLLLKISEESVLLLCSNPAYRSRFSFAFRPDRERRVQVGRSTSSGGVVGPLGLYCVDADCLVPPRAPAAAVPGNPLSGQLLPFRFVLTDRSAPLSLSRSGASMALLLVTPETPDDAFLGWKTGTGSGTSGGPLHTGIVAVEVEGRDEAVDLYERWKGNLPGLFPEGCRLDYYGMVPAEKGHGSFRASGEMGVLEHPTSGVTKSFLEMAALIRRRGRDMVGEGRPAH